MIRVSIYDYIPIFVYGLAAVLEKNSFTVTHAHGSPTRYLARTDVFLVEPQALPEADLPRFLTEVWPAVPVLALVQEANQESNEYLLRAGVVGVLERHTPVSVLAEKLRSVVAGGSRTEATTIVDTTEQRFEEPHALSPRELEVITQIAHGCTHRQVARMLGISHHTVDTYVKRIRDKLGVGNKAQLTRAAISLTRTASSSVELTK